MRGRSVFVTEKRGKRSHHYIQRYIAVPKSDPNSPLTQFSSCRPPPGKRLRYAFPIDPEPSSSHQKMSEANKAKNIDNQQGEGKLNGAYFVKNVLYIISKLLQASSHDFQKVVFVKRSLELHRRQEKRETVVDA